MTSLDVLSVGRVSVDLYSMESDVGFEDQQQFFKSVGGSPTNVAVAAARLGHKVALVTKVGDDEFGDYVRNRLASWGVETTFVGTLASAQTPLAFAALTPPESPKVVFYRGSNAPDTTLVVSDLPAEVVQNARILWVSQASLAQSSTSQTSLEWRSMRTRDQHTILDLDYRPSLWKSPEEAGEMARLAISKATVAVGNLEECRIALGTSDPNEAADTLLELGVKLAIIKLGAEGALMVTSGERIKIAPTPVEVVCGLGAGDAFGGALCHGILSGWSLEQTGRFASAAGAIVSGRLTCADAMPTLEELNELLGESV